MGVGGKYNLFYKKYTEFNFIELLYHSTNPFKYSTWTKNLFFKLYYIKEKTNLN